MNRHLPVVQRCTGACCQYIRIPLSPRELYGSPKRFEDGEVVADMLIFDEQSTYPDGSPVYIYRCRHWDSRSGDCTIYERRPKMCRDYPYSSYCQWPGCTDPVARMPPEVRNGGLFGGDDCGIHAGATEGDTDGG